MNLLNAFSVFPWLRSPAHTRTQYTDLFLSVAWNVCFIHGARVVIATSVMSAMAPNANNRLRTGGAGPNCIMCNNSVRYQIGARVHRPSAPATVTDPYLCSRVREMHTAHRHSLPIYTHYWTASTNTGAAQAHPRKWTWITTEKLSSH